MTRTPAPETLHATAVARRTGGLWRAVLLSGPSGVGKSDLALRLMQRGWRLIGDDYVQVWRSVDALFVAGDPRIRGRMEVRGVGLIDRLALPSARVAGLIQCGQATVERAPEAEMITVAGVRLPRLALDTRPASTVDVVAALIAVL